MPNSHYLAERLRAHARLYRHIAAETWSEDKARELVRLADECTRMADAIAAGEETSCNRPGASTRAKRDAGNDDARLRVAAAARADKI